VKTLEQTWLEVSLNPVYSFSAAHVRLNNMLIISNMNLIFLQVTSKIDFNFTHCFPTMNIQKVINILKSYLSNPISKLAT